MDAPAFRSAVCGQGRLLGVDWGQKRIGLALSDALGLTASPLEIMERQSFRTDVERIRHHIRTFSIRGVVVGLPLLGQAGGLSPGRSKEATIRSWACRLGSCLPLPLTFADEDFSSIEAMALCRHSRQTVDHLAAAVMLQRFLDGEKA